MTRLVHSRYNISVPLLHGRMLIYNSMSGATAILEPHDCEIFQGVSKNDETDLTDGTIANLIYGGFLVADEIDEIEILRQQYNAQRYDASTMILTIAPTLACNFGCDYCFQGKDKPSGSMSEDIQDAVIRLVKRAAQGIKRLHVAWYGGEPLLAMQVIERLSDRLIALCDLRSIGYDAMIVTNGFKLTADVARSLYVRRVKVAQITLDGAAEDHDQRRNLLGGQPTYRRIVENLKGVIDEVPLRVSVRINVDSRNSVRVRNLLDQLNEMGFARRKNFGVYFAPVEAITEGCHAVADVCMSKSQYGQLETELVRYAYDLGLTPLPYPRRFRGICGAVRPKGLVVAPNGDLHKCWDTISMSHHKVGTIFHPDSLKTDERAVAWMRWTPFNNETCTNCRILPVCAGSCAHKFINPDQTLGEAGTLPCPSWKYNIKERLIFRAERSGALGANDYDPDAIQTDPSEICSVPYPEIFVDTAGLRGAIIPLHVLETSSVARALE